MKRTLLIPLAILSIGGTLVALLWITRPVVAPKPIAVDAPLIRVQTLEKKKLKLIVEAQGTVVPRTQSELRSQVSGEVVWVSPSLVPGGFFERGDLLLRIDSIDYEANLESARAVLARAQSEAGRASKERDRQQRLADRSVASESRIDDAENAAHISEAILRQALAEVGRAERDLERTQIFAPYSGRVRSELVDPGQFVGRGESLARIYAVDYAEVRLPLPDRELRYLEIPLDYREFNGGQGEVPSAEGSGEFNPPELAGAPVKLRAQFAGLDTEWTGRVVRTEGEIDPRSRMVTLVARVEDPYGRMEKSGRPPLAVGLFVEAEIEGRVLPEALVIPRSALSGQSRVLVLSADNRIHFRPIKILRPEREFVVVESGLAEGERIAISPLPGAIDGMRVSVAEDTTPPAGTDS